MIFNSTLTINLDIIKNNVETVLSELPDGISLIPVLKANAYGLGLVEVAQVLNSHPRISHIGVAQVNEGIRLREHGITKPIMLLAGITHEQIHEAVTHKLEIPVHSIEMMHAIMRYCEEYEDANIPIHIKINTGFNRLGVKPGDELDQLLSLIRRTPNVIIRSTYTHPIEGEVFHSQTTYLQNLIYQEGLMQMEAKGINPGMMHFCNSGASEWFVEGYYDAIRIGRRLYMDSPDVSLRRDIPEPISWKASIVATHTLHAGESTGYNRAFIADETTDIAIVNVGYADGLLRYSYRDEIPVLVNGQRGKILAVCMDQCIINVTNIDCNVLDDVVFFGESQGVILTSSEVASHIHDEGCSLTTNITSRVHRQYIKNIE